MPQALACYFKNLNKDILYTELLKRTSNVKITFLKDVNKHIEVDKRGKFRYYYIPYFETIGFKDFILNLDSDSLYTIIPVLSIYGKEEDPHIILSKQILISNYSDHILIKDFLNKQLDKAIEDFNLDLDDRFHYLIFKYKKILINF